VASLPPQEPSGPTADEQVLEAEVSVDNAALLDADRKLRDALAAEGFTGRAYAQFEEEIVRYGYQVMIAWLRSGFIFIACSESGLKIPSGNIRPSEIEDLAQDTVANALYAFTKRGLKEGGWQPERGASLKAYFRRALLLQFANIWRKNLRTAPELRFAVPLETVPLTLSMSTPGPEDMVINRDEARSELAKVRNYRTQAALALAADGYEQEEIADIRGVTARAVEGYRRRHRAYRAALAREEGSNEQLRS
jgi:DNA-directed RNA polymerase specialized sigma24 family protein